MNPLKHLFEESRHVMRPGRGGGPFQPGIIFKIEKKYENSITV